MSSPLQHKIPGMVRAAPVLSAVVALTLGAAPASAQPVAPVAPTTAPAPATALATHPRADLGGHGPALRYLFLGPTALTAVGAIGTAIGYSYFRNQAIDYGNTLRSMGGIGACAHPTSAAPGSCFSVNLSLQARNDWGNWAWGTFSALAFELSFLIVTYAVAPPGAQFARTTW